MELSFSYVTSSSHNLSPGSSSLAWCLFTAINTDLTLSKLTNISRITNQNNSFLHSWTSLSYTLAHIQLPSSYPESFEATQSFFLKGSTFFLLLCKVNSSTTSYRNSCYCTQHAHSCFLLKNSLNSAVFLIYKRLWDISRDSFGSLWKSGTSGHPKWFNWMWPTSGNKDTVIKVV